MFNQNEMDFEIGLREQSIRQAVQVLQHQDLTKLTERDVGAAVVNVARAIQSYLDEVTIEDCKRRRELRNEYFEYVQAFDKEQDIKAGNVPPDDQPDVVQFPAAGV